MFNNDFLICCTTFGICYVTEDNKIVHIFDKITYLQDLDKKCYKHPCDIIDFVIFDTSLMILDESNDLYISDKTSQCNFYKILENIRIAKILKNCPPEDPIHFMLMDKYFYFV